MRKPSSTPASNGNEARFINHGCDPNCQSTTCESAIFIEAIRTIRPGEELAYDYQIQRDADDAPDVDEVFACRCGAQSCRGSMLEARSVAQGADGTRAVKARAAKRSGPRAQNRAPRT